MIYANLSVFSLRVILPPTYTNRIEGVEQARNITSLHHSLLLAMCFLKPWDFSTYPGPLRMTLSRFLENEDK